VFSEHFKVGICLFILTTRRKFGIITIVLFYLHTRLQIGGAMAEDMVLLGVRLDSETHRSFKLWCVRRGVKMSDVVRELVEGWLANQELEADPEGQIEEG
jgi:hypothetical protein